MRMDSMLDAEIQQLAKMLNSLRSSLQTKDKK